MTLDSEVAALIPYLGGDPSPPVRAVAEGLIRGAPASAPVVLASLELNLDRLAVGDLGLGHRVSPVCVCAWVAACLLSHELTRLGAELEDGSERDDPARTEPALVLEADLKPRARARRLRRPHDPR